MKFSLVPKTASPSFENNLDSNSATLRVAALEYPKVSPYLENMVVQKKENNEGISVSGGMPLKMFSEYHGGGDGSVDKSVESFMKIGGLSVPIGLVLSPENNAKINVKYSDNNNNKKKEFTGGSPSVIHEDTSIYENAILGGSKQKTNNGIENMKDSEMDILLGMVCELHKKQNTRKNK